MIDRFVQTSESEPKITLDSPTRHRSLILNLKYRRKKTQALEASESELLILEKSISEMSPILNTKSK